MIFTTPAFVLFFLLFFWLYPNTRGTPRKYLLLGASYLFYASWSAPFLLLLIGAILCTGCTPAARAASAKGMAA